MLYERRRSERPATPAWVRNFPLKYQKMVERSYWDTTNSKTNTTPPIPQTYTHEETEKTPLEQKLEHSKEWYASRGRHFGQVREQFRHGKNDAVLESHEMAQRQPLYIRGLEYNIVVGDNIICIGCFKRTIEEWRTMPDREILAMDGRKALEFWQKHKPTILHMADLHTQQAA